MTERRISRAVSLVLATVAVACSGDSHAGSEVDAIDDTATTDAAGDGSASADAVDAGDGSGHDGGASDAAEPDASDATDGSGDAGGGADGGPDDGGTDTETSPDAATDTTDTTDEPDAADTADVDAAADTATDGATPGHPCAEAGGICTAGTCGDGTEIPRASAACAFDDGPGLCCAPPQPEPTGETCTARGGLCAPIAGCGFVSGYFASASECSAIGGPAWVCCIPESQCGPSAIECCAPPTVFRSTCDRGEEVCTHIEGSTPVPLDTCLSE